MQVIRAKVIQTAQEYFLWVDYIKKFLYWNAVSIRVFRALIGTRWFMETLIYGHLKIWKEHISTLFCPYQLLVSTVLHSTHLHRFLHAEMKWKRLSAQFYILFSTATTFANGNQRVKCTSGEISQKSMHSILMACFCIYLHSFSV